MADPAVARHAKSRAPHCAFHPCGVVCWIWDLGLAVGGRWRRPHVVCAPAAPCATRSPRARVVHAPPTWCRSAARARTPCVPPAARPHAAYPCAVWGNGPPQPLESPQPMVSCVGRAWGRRDRILVARKAARPKVSFVVRSPCAGLSGVRGRLHLGPTCRCAPRPRTDTTWGAEVRGHRHLRPNCRRRGRLLGTPTFCNGSASCSCVGHIKHNDKSAVVGAREWHTLAI